MSQPPVPPGPPPASPPPPPPAGQPGQPGGQPPAPGTMLLTMQGNVMTSNMITPTVRLNGHPVQVKYGENRIPLPPGRWHVDIYAQWLRRYGQANLEFDLAPGQTVPVFYAAPLHQFTSGAIGHVKQPRKGAVAFALLLAFLLALAVLLVLLNI